MKMLKMQNKATDWEKNVYKTYLQQRACVQNTYYSINNPIKS